MEGRIDGCTDVELCDITFINELVVCAMIIGVRLRPCLRLTRRHFDKSTRMPFDEPHTQPQPTTCTPFFK